MKKKCQKPHFVVVFPPPLWIYAAIMDFQHLNSFKIKSPDYKLSNEPSVVNQLFPYQKLLTILTGASFTVILAEIKYTY